MTRPEKQDPNNAHCQCMDPDCPYCHGRCTRQAKRGLHQGRVALCDKCFHNALYEGEKLVISSPGI